MDTFKNAFTHLKGKLAINPDMTIWEEFGKYSSQLDVDEA
jgi:hypothetical protein